MQQHALIIQQTSQWIQQIIIKHNFCPFAARVVDHIDYQLASDPSPAGILSQLSLLWEKLDQQPAIETSFLIFPQAFSNFYDYLEMLHLAEAHLAATGYEGIYQLASFHPQYCFAGSTEDDPANYTNRSPYPMFHLLREASLEQAIAHHPDPEGIPAQNIERAQTLGLKQMKAERDQIILPPH